MLSLRWLLNVGGVPIQLLAPCAKPGVGSGKALSSARPCELQRLWGMMLPANGSPVAGVRMTRVGSSALQAPLLSAAWRAQVLLPAASFGALQKPWPRKFCEPLLVTRRSCPADDRPNSA